MEISSLDAQSIRIKGKQASFVIDPTKGISKTSAEAILQLRNTADFTGQKIEGARLTIQGPGEYEIGGVKISAFRLGADLVYDIKIDGISLFLAIDELMSKQDILQKSKDIMKDYHIVVLNTQEVGDQSGLPSFSPRVVVFYGNNAKEGAKALGKEEITPTAKYQTTADKLPDEMEVVVLQ